MERDRLAERAAKPVFRKEAREIEGIDSRGDSTGSRHARARGASRRFSRLTGALVAWAGKVGRDPADGSETALRKRLTVLLAVGTLPMTIAWSAIYYLAGAPLAAAMPGVYSVVTPVNTALFGLTRNFRLYRFLQLFMTLFLPFGVTISLGGFGPSSAVIIWAALCPLMALLIDDLRGTIGWAAGFVCLVVVSAALEPHLRATPLSPSFVTWFFALNLGTVIVIVFALLYYFVAERDFFYDRSETLLLNVLPRDVSEALKAGQSTIAAHYDCASILFADVVGFTPLSAAMTPMGLVNLLNELFQEFDDLIERYGLEKIKTIGDCYMVAAGVPNARADHATALIGFALDVLEMTSARRFGGRRLALRIGVNSGPVVAGVIGRKKFVYDLWGDAVNIASRMESHGQSGVIQVTRSTYELVRDAFVCEPGGRIEVKGADEVEVWRVVGRKAPRA